MRTISKNVLSNHLLAVLLFSLTFVIQLMVFTGNVKSSQVGTVQPTLVASPVLSTETPIVGQLAEGQNTQSQTPNNSISAPYFSILNLGFTFFVGLAVGVLGAVRWHKKKTHEKERVLIEQMQNKERMLIEQTKLIERMLVEQIQKKERLYLKHGLVTGYTHKGTRDQNEDAIDFTETSEARILVLADGIGSSHKAEVASKIVVKHFVTNLLRLCNNNEEINQQTLMEIYSTAIEKLQSELKLYDLHTNALATTIVAIVETATHFHYTYLGNGGIYLFRKDNPLKNRILYYSLMSSQDVGQETAALSPKGMSHKPFVGTIPKSEGDVIITGTDGIFTNAIFQEYFSQRKFHLPSHMFRKIQELPFDREPIENWLRMFVDEVLTLPTQRGGSLIDDNLTLGIIGTQYGNDTKL